MSGDCVSHACEPTITAKHFNKYSQFRFWASIKICNNGFWVRSCQSLPHRSAEAGYNMRIQNLMSAARFVLHGTCVTGYSVTTKQSKRGGALPCEEDAALYGQRPCHRLCLFTGALYGSHTFRAYPQYRTNIHWRAKGNSEKNSILRAGLEVSVNDHLVLAAYGTAVEKIAISASPLDSFPSNRSSRIMVPFSIQNS